MSDELHPAYSKLFVQTELVPPSKPSCAPAEPDRTTRRRLDVPSRRRARRRYRPHLYETDRSRFIGRGNT